VFFAVSGMLGPTGSSLALCICLPFGLSGYLGILLIPIPDLAFIFAFIFSSYSGAETPVKRCFGKLGRILSIPLF